MDEPYCFWTGDPSILRPVSLLLMHLFIVIVATLDSTECLWWGGGGKNEGILYLTNWTPDQDLLVVIK